MWKRTARSGTRGAGILETQSKELLFFKVKPREFYDCSCVAAVPLLPCPPSSVFKLLYTTAHPPLTEAYGLQAAFFRVQCAKCK